ncbi:hypothetical protein [Nocardia donostiensis]|uniref:1,4-alpha-glucan branching enzyme n=1 Tax=Nocardia donostiensis TaxID=1538463 RepID=A0A1V2TKM3_9NOCA|nr:hypothetical protein [Nocardia donostiensis]ONM50080.1 hypothetical protein B0T46_03005 [Nocardia donostiensis]OQS15742.1 hypothetical protein B0T36_07100 [Nocardia donostiensis]OQS16449.1 hypothetical protein B0T44_25470 [Nocardia donostiensis]
MKGGLSAAPGDTLVTTSHETIRQWAEERGANPATMPGSEGDEKVGVLRLDFPRYGGAVLRPVAWEDWFATFDARNLSFRYQEIRADGSPSNFFRIERAHSNDRESAHP